MGSCTYRLAKWWGSSLRSVAVVGQQLPVLAGLTNKERQDVDFSSPLISTPHQLFPRSPPPPPPPPYIANHVFPSLQCARLHAPLSAGKALAAPFSKHISKGDQGACPRDLTVPGGRGVGGFPDDRRHRRGGYDAYGGVVRGAEY